MAAMFSVMRNAAQPFRNPDPGKPDASQTLWQTVLDQTHRRYAFESTTRPNIVWVDFDKLDFSEGAPQLKLDLLGQLALEGGLAGQVSDRFEDIGPLRFLTVHNHDLVRAIALELVAEEHRVEAIVEAETAGETSASD